MARGLVPRALAFARLVRPRHIVSHMPAGKSARGVDMPVPHDASKPVHEVQDVYTVLSPFGIAGEPPALTVVPRLEAQRTPYGRSDRRAAHRLGLGVFPLV